MACLAGLGVAVQDVLGRVLAADAGQYLVREGLGVDGDPGGPVLLDDRQLFGVGAVRAACLHRIFYDFGQVKILPHGAHELPQLVGRKAGGGAAADVDAAQGQPGLVSLPADLFHLVAQAIHIGLHHLAVTVKVAAHEAAVATPGRAERDADVQAVGLGRTAHLQNRLLQVGDGLGHLVFLLRAVEALQEEVVDVRFAPSGGTLVVDEAHRAHAGHLAPRRADTGPFAALPHHGPQAVRLFLGPHAVLARFGRGQGKGCHRVEQADQMFHLVPRGQPRDINLHVVLSFIEKSNPLRLADARQLSRKGELSVSVFA